MNAMKNHFRLVVIILLAFYSLGADAQSHRRYERRKAKTEKKIAVGQKEGKLNSEEMEEIEERQHKLNKTNRRVLRDGQISEQEQNKLNRRLRKVKRETRRNTKD